MTRLQAAFARLDGERARLGFPPMPPGVDRQVVISGLEQLGLTPHDDIVDWYVRYGPGVLVYGAEIYSSDQTCDVFAEDVAIAEDFDPDERESWVDWFPLTLSFRNSAYARPCDGPPPVRAIDNTREFESDNAAPDLATVVETWADRCESGYYILDQGRPWRTNTAPDDDLWHLARI